MNTSANGRVRRSSAEWESLLSRYDESGRSRAAFCESEGIAQSTFDVWHRKLRRAKSPRQQSPSEFVEMTPVVDRIGGWALEIELPDGTRARLRG